MIFLAKTAFNLSVHYFIQDEECNFHLLFSTGVRIQLCTEFRTWLFVGSTFCKMTCCFRGYLRVLMVAFQSGKHIKIMFFYFLKIILDIIISNPKTLKKN